MRCRSRKGPRPTQRHGGHPVQIQRHSVLGSSRSDAGLRKSPKKRSRSQPTLLVLNLECRGRADMSVANRAGHPKWKYEYYWDQLFSPFVDLSPQFVVQARTGVRREVRQFHGGENLNGKFGLPHKDCAVPAHLQMHLEFFPDGDSEFAVDITGNAADDAVAVQCAPPCRKTRSNFCRSFNRARNSRDFTAASEIPSASAVSSVERPSTSRSTNATRKSGC